MDLLLGHSPRCSGPSSSPCQDASFTHGVTAGRSFGWKCGGTICAATASYAARINAPVMEPGAASAGTCRLPGQKATGRPPAGSQGCQDLLPRNEPPRSMHTAPEIASLCTAEPSPTPDVGGFVCGAPSLPQPSPSCRSRCACCPQQRLSPTPGTSPGSWGDCGHPDTPSCCRRRTSLGP